MLFASLWALRHGLHRDFAQVDEFGHVLEEPVRFPLGHDTLGDIVNFDLTGEKMCMFEWIQEWSGVPA